MSAAPVVPVHAEATEVADTLRWVIPVGTLGFVGEPTALPAPLQSLYDDGVLTAPTLVEPSAVLLRMAAGRSWRADGPRVRRALQAALAEPREWRAPSDACTDDVLRAAAEEVLAGEVGDFVRGHGGVIEVVDVAADEVTIELSGACAGCPASGITVQHRFETALRRRYPGLRGVVAHERRDASPRGPALLSLLPTRHRDA
ncbi:MAG: NifU family protein [Nocardioidaceae bacterium]|nr:NifU family protein [Nocardioidaceae bacterium]MCL2614286.1 NifU family protein [Nocardioidaceae bacterium]